MASACPVCGFHATTVSPSDAAAALRSYPRRYRGVLLRPSNDEPDDPVARRGRDGWSALDHATYAANSIDASRQQLHQVLVHDNADVNPPPVDPPTPLGTDSASPEETFARLRTVAEGLADEVDRAKGEQWNRTGVTPDGQALTAVDIVRHAVHQGFHHLRAAEKVLQEVIGRPVAVDEDDDD